MLSKKQLIYRKADLRLLNLNKTTDINTWVILGFATIQRGNKKNDKEITVVLASYINNKINLNETTLIDIPIGAIGIINEGMIVHNGRLRDYHKKDIKNYEIEIPEIKLGKIDSGYNLFNISQKADKNLNMLYNGNFFSFQAKIKKQIKTCYISCAEIFRFYYGSSNGLLNIALSGAKASDIVYSSKNILHNEKGISVIELRKYLYDIDAPLVARIAFNEYAKRCFESIFTKTKHSFVKENPLNKYLHVIPPIDQNNIKWKINANEMKNGSWLITNLISCDAKFPFNQLIFGRENDGRSNKNNKDCQTIDRPKSKPQISEETSLANQEGMDAPNNHIETITLDNSLTSGGFTGLKNTKVDKLVKSTQKTKNNLVFRDIITGISQINGMSTSSSNNPNSKVAPLKIINNPNVLYEPPDNNENPKLSMNQVLVSLCNREDIESNIICLKGYEFDEELGLSKFPFKDNDDKGDFRLLKIYSIKYNHHNFYIVEFYNMSHRHQSKSTLLMTFKENEAEHNQEYLIKEIQLYQYDPIKWAKIDCISDESENLMLTKHKKRLVHSKDRKPSNIVNKIISRMEQLISINP